MTKGKLLILIGPTAVGKTALSIDIAHRFDLEVISGDSMQIYKHMDIGTGKITPDEMQGVPHHMLDIIEPDAEYSVKDYQEHVSALIERAHKADKIPFIVGGTGLYIKSLIYDNYQFSDEDQQKKERLTAQYEALSNDELYVKLEAADLELAKSIHPNNRRRVIRTLVRFDLGEFSNKETYNNSPKYDIFIVGLHLERDQLYERINLRVKEMFSEGLLEEVTFLREQYELSKTASAAIGYKEFDDYFYQHIDLSAVCERVQQHSRQYAKRQLTFFRNQLPVSWYDIGTDSSDRIMEDIQQFIYR